jgi:hypothetical protein
MNRNIKMIVMSPNTIPISRPILSHMPMNRFISTKPPKHITYKHPPVGTCFSKDSQCVTMCPTKKGILPVKSIKNKEKSFGVCNPTKKTLFLLTSLISTGDTLSNVIITGTLKSRQKTSVIYSLVITDKRQKILNTILSGNALIINNTNIKEICIKEPGYIALITTEVKGRLNDVGVINFSYTYFGY